MERAGRESATSELAARGIGESLREAAAKSVTAEHLAAEAERLRRVVAISQPTPRQRIPIKGLLAAALVGAFALVGTGMYAARSASQPPLTVELQSVVGRTGGVAGAESVRLSEHAVVTSDPGSSLLKFSDGSRVTVEAGTRLRLAALMNQGATLLLEKGQADVVVVHRNVDTNWSVAAGPFTIAVTGTKFGVAWDPAHERLVVELREGSVEVSGPKFTSPAALKAGERFEALSGDRNWRITPLGSKSDAWAQPFMPPSMPSSPAEVVAPTSDDAALATQATSVNGSSVASTAGTVRAKPGTARNTEALPGAAAAMPPSATSGARPTEARQWSKLVASGEFRQVTREADAMGLMVCLAQCSASDLRALADASRYTGRLDTAEAALRELYTRFPGQASTATYLLGAVDEARGRSESALRWYTEYLSRVSSGGVVAEAKAARMRMLVATGGKAAAENAAREYLDSYPKGSAAGLARKVLEGR